jgi:hypothetical protein
MVRERSILMAWIITKDIIDNGEMEGESWIRTGLKDKKLCKVCVHPFRLLDDDDIVYFEGFSSDSSSFNALDTLGVAYGCTDIQYLENGKWESL